MKPSPYMDYMQNHALIYDIQKFVYWSVGKNHERKNRNVTKE